MLEFILKFLQKHLSVTLRIVVAYYCFIIWITKSKFTRFLIDQLLVDDYSNGLIDTCNIINVIHGAEHHVLEIVERTLLQGSILETFETTCLRRPLGVRFRSVFTLEDRRLLLISQKNSNGRPSCASKCPCGPSNSYCTHSYLQI